MTVRRGVSLVNVMVFLLFVMMLTAQMFFFTENAFNEAADEREMMAYRMNLDALVKEAEEALRKDEIDEHRDETVNNYAEFFGKTKVWPKSDNTYVTIHDLDFKIDKNTLGTFNREIWNTQSGSNMYKKIFAAIPSNSDDVPHYRYYLIRAWVNLPENFYGTKLMYQELVKRNENNHSDLQTLSFQEVWF